MGVEYRVILPAMNGQDTSTVNESTPVVSVAITACQSEKWLSRALDSLLGQQTRFPVEIVVGVTVPSETVAVAQSYRERNPAIVRVIAQPRNLGIQRDYYETFEQCRGKYIAWLDADDYWTDPEKPTAQVQVLESDAG